MPYSIPKPLSNGHRLHVPNLLGPCHLLHQNVHPRPLHPHLPSPRLLPILRRNNDSGHHFGPHHRSNGYLAMQPNGRNLEPAAQERILPESSRSGIRECRCQYRN